VEIFLERKDARTKQRYSVGVGKGGLPFLGIGLLYPLTKKNRKLFECKRKKKLYKQYIFVIYKIFLINISMNECYILYIKYFVIRKNYFGLDRFSN